MQHWISKCTLWRHSENYASMFTQSFNINEISCARSLWMTVNFFICPILRTTQRTSCGTYFRIARSIKSQWNRNELRGYMTRVSSSSNRFRDTRGANDKTLIIDDGAESATYSMQMYTTLHYDPRQIVKSYRLPRPQRAAANHPTSRPLRRCAKWWLRQREPRQRPKTSNETSPGFDDQRATETTLSATICMHQCRTPLPRHRE